MCLATTKATAKVAEKDIVCYKIMEHRGRGRRFGTYRSFFRNFPYCLGTTYQENRFVDNVSATYSYFTKQYSVNYGFHSYWDPVHPTHSETLVKCIIPKGSKYFIGVGNPGSRQYCSDKIKIMAEWYNGEWVTELPEGRKKKAK